MNELLIYPNALFFIPIQISWLTKQGYTREYIEEVITSDALNEPQSNESLSEDQKHKEELDKDIKAAQEAANAAGEAVKNVFGGMVGLGGTLLGGKQAPKPAAPQQQVHESTKLSFAVVTFQSVVFCSSKTFLKSP